MSYGVDDSEALVEVMGVYGLVVVVGAERDRVAVAGAAGEVVPVVLERGRAVVVAAAVGVAGRRHIAEAGCVWGEVHVARVLTAQEANGSSRTSSSSHFGIGFKFKYYKSSAAYSLRRLSDHSCFYLAIN